jgi:hypothetical protein
MMAIYGFCPFSFQRLYSLVFQTENRIDLIIFKMFLECVGKVLEETQAYVALGVNFLCGIANSA